MGAKDEFIQYYTWYVEVYLPESIEYLHNTPEDSPHWLDIAVHGPMVSGFAHTSWFPKFADIQISRGNTALTGQFGQSYQGQTILPEHVKKYLVD
jgi:hypothetical protein